MDMIDRVIAKTEELIKAARVTIDDRGVVRVGDGPTGDRHMWTANPRVANMVTYMIANGIAERYSTKHSDSRGLWPVRWVEM